MTDSSGETGMTLTNATVPSKQKETKLAWMDAKNIAISNKGDVKELQFVL